MSRMRGNFSPQRADESNVGAGLDFDLDALVAGGEFLFDFSEQRRESKAAGR